MATSRKALREMVKSQYMEMFVKMLSEQEDVGITGTNEFNFPVVDSEGNEDFVVVKVTIPTGSRDGEPYDGYGARNDWEIHLKEKAEKDAKSAADKAKRSSVTTKPEPRSRRRKSK